MDLKPPGVSLSDPLPASCTVPVLRRTFLAMGLALFTGCTERSEAPFRVATLPWPGYESFHLAQSLGYFDPAKIRPVELTSASQSSQAIRNGTVDAAMLTLDEALFLIQDGIDLRVVLIMDVSNGADVAMARPEITTLADLRNKRIGVETGAIGSVMLDAVLSAAGLTVSDLNVIAMPVNEHVDAYHDGKVDAVVTFEPARTKLLEQGARILFDSSKIPDRIFDVLVVRSAALEQYRDANKNLIAAHFKALTYLAQNPKDSAIRLAPFLGVAADQVLPQFDGLKLPSLEENKILLSGSPSKLSQKAAELADLMLRNKLMHHVVSVSHLVNSELLP